MELGNRDLPGTEKGRDISDYQMHYILEQVRHTIFVAVFVLMYVLTGGLINPRPWRGRCQAGYSNTGGPPLPRKRAPLTKKYMLNQGAAHCV